MLYQTDYDSIKNAKVEDIEELIAESEFIVEGIKATSSIVTEVKRLGQIYSQETESVLSDYKKLVDTLKNEISERNTTLNHPIRWNRIHGKFGDR